MKTQIYFLTLLLLPASGYAQKPNLFEDDQRNGNVKSITISEWEEDTATDPWQIHEVHYDANGLPVRAVRNKEGYFINYLDLKYRDTMLIEETYTQKNNVEYTRYEYDSKGRITEQRESVEGGRGYYFSIEYTYKPNLTIEEKFYEFKEFCDYKEYYQNAAGQDSLIVKKDEKGKIVERKFKYYDEEGRDTLTLCYKKKGNKLKWKVRSEFINDTTSVLITYDSKGNEEVHSEQTFYSFDELYEWKVKGLFSDTLTTYTYEYEFDEMGNWIQKLGYKDGELFLMTRREFVYYEE
ncbi:MAG: hypothetical protein HUJ25_07245 [Crocinitomicaceae bacterium]|nr:hypothetical protein [Crocinitomicaceae bacterium]